MADKILHQVIRYAPGIGEANFNEAGDIVNKGYVDSRIPNNPKWRATATAATAVLNLALPVTLAAGLYKMTVFVNNAGNAARTFRGRFNNVSTASYLRGSSAIDYWDLFNGAIAAQDSGLSQSLFFVNTNNVAKGQLGQIVRGINVNGASAVSQQNWSINLGAIVGGINSVQMFSTEAGSNIGADSFIEIERF